MENDVLIAVLLTVCTRACMHACMCGYVIWSREFGQGQYFCKVCCILDNTSSKGSYRCDIIKMDLVVPED